MAFEKLSAEPWFSSQSVSYLGKLAARVEIPANEAENETQGAIFEF